MGGNAKCLLCDEYTELTEHHAKEIDKVIQVCPACGKWIEKYVNLLKSFGYYLDK